MKPSAARMLARDSFSFEPGMRTVSKCAVLALRMRVSMSAMGSVMVIGRALPSPARLGHARDLARVHHHPEADAAEPELAVDGLRPSAPTAPGVCPDLELGRALLLLDECLLGHGAIGSPVGRESRTRRGRRGLRRPSGRWSRW